MLLDLYEIEWPDPWTQFDSAEDGLSALLRARPGLAGVDLDVGWPFRGLQPTHIWIDGDLHHYDVRDQTPNAGEREMEEELTLVVHVVVQHTAPDTFQSVRNKALALGAEIETAVRTDTTLNGTVTSSRLAGGLLKEFVYPDGRGRGLQVTYEITYRTQLYG